MEHRRVTVLAGMLVRGRRTGVKIYFPVRSRSPGGATKPESGRPSGPRAVGAGGTGYVCAMVTQTTEAGATALAAIVRRPRRALLAFDFDGVLSPIIEDPEQSQAFPGAFPALAEIGQLAGLIAIVTGRPVPFVTSRENFSLIADLPEFLIFGQYGLERWDSTTKKTASGPISPGIAAARGELLELLRQPGPAAGSWLEDKGNAVAVHTRRTADPIAAFDQLSGPVQNIAVKHNLRLEPGKMVLELRPPGINKGDVIREVVRERGCESVLYAGDDLGDLSAFAVLDSGPRVRRASRSAARQPRPRKWRRRPTWWWTGRPGLSGFWPACAAR